MAAKAQRTQRKRRENSIRDSGGVLCSLNEVSLFFSTPEESHVSSNAGMRPEKLHPQEFLPVSHRL